MIVVDAPWCGIKTSHASYLHTKTQFTSETVKKEKWIPGKMVKDRNEPCTIMYVIVIEITHL